MSKIVVFHWLVQSCGDWQSSRRRLIEPILGEVISDSTEMSTNRRGDLRPSMFSQQEQASRQQSFPQLQQFHHRSFTGLLPQIESDFDPHAPLSVFGLPMEVNWAYPNYQWGDPPDLYTIFVGDLSDEVTDADLFTFFASYESCVGGKVMRDQITCCSRGFGFVSFRDHQDAQRAINDSNGKLLGGRQIRCNWSTNGAGAQSHVDKHSLDGKNVEEVLHGSSEDCKEMSNSEAPENDPRCTTVFVGNLGPEITQEDLFRHFHALGAGVIEDARIHRDQGFGFVQYNTHSEAARAIRMGNIQPVLSGRLIKCSWGRKPNPTGSGTTWNFPFPWPAAASGSNLPFPRPAAASGSNLPFPRPAAASAYGPPIFPRPMAGSAYNLPISRPVAASAYNLPISRPVAASALTIPRFPVWLPMAASASNLHRFPIRLPAAASASNLPIPLPTAASDSNLPNALPTATSASASNLPIPLRTASSASNLPIPLPLADPNSNLPNPLSTAALNLPIQLSPAASDSNLPIQLLPVASDSDLPIQLLSVASDSDLPIPLPTASSALNLPNPLPTPPSASASSLPIPLPTAASASNLPIPLPTAASASASASASNIPIPLPTDASASNLPIPLPRAASASDLPIPLPTAPSASAPDPSLSPSDLLADDRQLPTSQTGASNSLVQPQQQSTQKQEVVEFTIDRDDRATYDIEFPALKSRRR